MLKTSYIWAKVISGNDLQEQARFGCPLPAASGISNRYTKES